MLRIDGDSAAGRAAYRSYCEKSDRIWSSLIDRSVLGKQMLEVLADYRKAIVDYITAELERLA